MSSVSSILSQGFCCFAAWCFLVPIPAGAAEPARLSTTLEIVTVATGERTVIHRGEGSLDAPHFSADGTAVWFNGGGRLQRLALTAGAKPALVDTGFAVNCLNDHGLSPDGTQLVISDLTETGKSQM